MERRSLSDQGLLLFVIALFCALVLPALFMDGMFMDGVFYASISRNYAEGMGTFWNMQYSATNFSSMHEQPPLMFFLQGMFFKVLGNSLYTERIYCMITAAVNTWVLVECWNILTKKQTGTITTAWLPLLLWIIMPVTFYAFINNLEECTMAIFVLLAFRSILKAILVAPEKFYHWIIAGAWILAAGLTKGIQGMFLISAPFWCFVILKNGTFPVFVKRSLLIVLIPAIFVVIAFFTPVIHDSFEAYFTSRFGKTFSGTTANTNSYFHILFELLIDTIPTMAVCLVLLIAGRKTANLVPAMKQNARLSLFVFACGMSGILPLMVTLEQRGFYLVTALPLLAIACALPLQPIAVRLTNYFAEKNLRKSLITGIGILVLTGSVIITFLNAGKPKRDAENIAALREVAAITGERQIIGSDSFVQDNWPLMCYGQRYFGMSFTHTSDERVKYILLQKGAPAPTNTAQISLNSQVFDLYRLER